MITIKKSQLAFFAFLLLFVFSCSGSNNPLTQSDDNIDYQATADSDGDGIDDNKDNCPNAYNANQEDFDLDGIGNVCDSEDNLLNTTNGEESEKNDKYEVDTEETKNINISLFAGRYTWIGNKKGVTTNKFISDSNISLYDSMLSEWPDELITDIAFSQTDSNTPARTSRIYAVEFHKNSETSKKYLYFLQGNCGLKRLNIESGEIQFIAMNTCIGGSDDGLGTNATINSAYDLAIADRDFNTLGIKKGDILIPTPGEHSVRKVRISETSSGPVSFVSTLNLPQIESPYFLSYKNGKIYLLTQPTSSSFQLSCETLFTIKEENNKVVVEELITQNELPARCGGLEIIENTDRPFDNNSNIVDGNNIFISGSKTLAHFNDEGTLLGKFTSVEIPNYPSNPIITPSGDGIILGYRRIIKVPFPINDQSNFEEIAGSKTEWDWREFDILWPTLKTSSDARFWYIQSLALDQDNPSIYIADDIVRRIDFTAGQKNIDSELCERSLPVVGIPNISSFKNSTFGDGTDPFQARFALAYSLMYHSGSNETASLLIDDLNHHALRKIDLDPESYNFKKINTPLKGSDFSYIYNSSIDSNGDLYFMKAVVPNSILKMSGDPLGLHGEANPNTEIEVFFSNSDVSSLPLQQPFSLSDFAIMNDYIYITDYKNNIIIRTDLQKSFIEVFAGQIGISGSSAFNTVIQPLEALFFKPSIIKAIDGKLYLATNGTFQISVIEFAENGSATIRNIAGCGISKHADGIGSDGCFHTITDFSLLNNELIIVDASDRTVRSLNLNSLELKTIAGYPGRYYYEDGIASQAGFVLPSSIVCIPEMEGCFIGEQNAIRRIDIFNVE